TRISKTQRILAQANSNLERLMAKRQTRIRTLVIAAIALSVILASIGRWIVSGGPVGYCCGSCQTQLGGRAIIGSSYYFLTKISLMADQTRAVLNVGGRQVVVRADEVAVDGTPETLIPAECKRLEVSASAGILRVLADGKTIREVY